jgi:hypothetical protein
MPPKKIRTPIMDAIHKSIKKRDLQAAKTKRKKIEKKHETEEQEEDCKEIFRDIINEIIEETPDMETVKETFKVIINRCQMDEDKKDDFA